MIIVTERSICTDALVRKFEKFDLVSFDDIEKNSYRFENEVVILCSLNFQSENDKDSTLIGEYIRKWIENIIRFSVFVSKNGKIKRLFLWINYEEDNIINDMIDEYIVKFFSSEVTDIQMFIYESHISIMTNYEYARTVLGYNEMFTKDNIEQLMKIKSAILGKSPVVGTIKKIL